MHVTIVGLGLIGGSIARSLRGAGGPAAGWVVDGWSPSPETRRAALDAGVIGRARPLDEALGESELIVLAAPPLACLELLDEIGGTSRSGLRPGTTITDVASTKARIVARANALGLPFVGGHPMAGRERAGFAASSPDLFVDRPWVVVKGAAASGLDVERVAALARACGARPIEMDAPTHDAAVAAVSHVPLILSTALVEAVCGRHGEPEPAEWAAARRLAASGWRDMTRLARGDPPMGAGIAATNAAPIVSRLRQLREALDEWIAALSEPGGPDAAALEARFASAAARLGDQTDPARPTPSPSPASAEARR